MAMLKLNTVTCRYTLLSVAAATLIFLPQVASAQSCQSATKVAADVFDKVGTEAVALGCSAVKIALGKDQQFDQNDLLSCYKDASFYTGLARSLTSWWNTQVANNNWSTLGPRNLEMDKNLDGKLIGTSGRMFIAAVPLETDSATIKISERDGKGKASFVVCTHAPGGKWHEVATGSFNDTGDRKDNESETRTVKLTGVKGLLASINIDGKSVANTFSYTIRADD